MFLDAPVMISGKSNYHFLNDRVCAKIKKSDSEFDCVSVNYPPPPPPTQLIEAFYVRLSIAEQPVSKTAMFFFCAYTCVLP